VRVSACILLTYEVTPEFRHAVADTYIDSLPSANLVPAATLQASLAHQPVRRAARPACLCGRHAGAKGCCCLQRLQVCSVQTLLMQCAVHADSCGDDDDEGAAAAGVTGSVPDLSMMRLDSCHESRCAALAYSTGDAASPPSKTSISGDSGAVYLLQPAQQP